MRICRWQFKPTVSHVLTFGITLLAVLMIVSMVQKSARCQLRQDVRDALQSEVAVIEAQVEQLRAQRSGPESQAVIEGSLRQDFGLVGPNEGTVILRFSEAPPESASASTPRHTGTEASPPFWRRWANLFINL